MTDPSFLLRAGQAGAIVKGTPGNVLTIQPDGTVRGEQPSSEGVVYTMPEPNGVNDLPEFDSLLAAASATGGTIQFRSGLYKSPTGFTMNGVNCVALRGAGAGPNGLSGTVLQYTGARSVNSAIVKLLSCYGCTVSEFAFLASPKGAEHCVLIGSNGFTDSVRCYVFDCECIGNYAADPLTTSATNVNLSTAINVPTAIVLTAVNATYPVGTQILVCSRAGGSMKGEIVSLVGNVLTFIPRDVFNSGIHNDWDVIQSTDGITMGGTEGCSVDRVLATLCYNSFHINGVACSSGRNCLTSAPLGPSFRSDSSSSDVKIEGNAEFNLRYDWTTALFTDGVINFEASVGMGDGFSKGVPYVLRGCQASFIHNLNGQSTVAGSSLISMEGCVFTRVDTVLGSIPGGYFIQNLSGNSHCYVNNLYAQVVMNTFVGGNILGFTEWYDVATQRLNFEFFTSFQFLASKYGMAVPSAVVPMSNGINNSVSIGSGFQVIVGPTAAFSLSGVAPFVSDGWRISFVYYGTQTLTLLHDNAGSPAGLRLKCSTGANIILAPVAGGFVYFDLLYSNGYWIVLLPKL